MVADELSKKIEMRIKDFINDSTNPQDLRDYAEKLNALPIYIGWTGFLAIRPDGQIVLQDTEDSKIVGIEKDIRERNIALFQGSKKYPELFELIPAKTEDDPVCPYCSGSGESPLAVEHNLPNIICSCGGLGWIPKEEKE
jgi:hypothetical protein